VVHVLQQMGGGSVNKQARDTLYHYFHDEFRFGQLTGIEQVGEDEGTIIGPNEGDGRNVRYANMTFGQGMDVTMIQTASAFSALINGGTYYQPHLVSGVKTDSGVRKKDPLVVKSGIVKPESSNLAREMIWQGRKQGFFGKNDPEGYMIGGKTGTSQVIDPKTGKYSDTNSIGTYLGFGATNTPSYVIMVKVEDSKVRGGYEGTTAAGPIFNDLNSWMIDYLHLQPGQ
jgi:cell division protein FtsI/penicillin-binding protein 2